MAPLPKIWLESLIPRDEPSALSPLEAHHLAARSLYERDATPTFSPGSGTRPPETFNNQAFLALFASIGACMALASIWFFFWAKNGGFHFQQDDWDDYKSTVLRRKGPDGRTLSNATKSTRLGIGSIAGTQHYKACKHQAKSVVGRDDKGRKGVLGKRGWANTHSILYSDDYQTESFATQTVSDEMTEVRSMRSPRINHSKRHRDRDVQDYKKERPARVGGLNRVADGSHLDTDYSDTYSDAPLKKPRQEKARERENERERAERRARDEAAKMERRWKKEAEEAAAAVARETARTTVPQPPKTASPSKPPASNKQRQRSASRSASPKKRDFSYQHARGPEVLSTVYTDTTSARTPSYYDAYRPQREQGSPKKAGGGGYRRGADRDLD